MGFNSKLEFYKKRQFSDKLNATFSFLRENAAPYLKAQILIAGPVLILVSILMNEVSGGFLALAMDPQGLSANDIIDLLGAYGLSLVSILVTLALIPSVTYGYMIQYQTLEPKEISMSNIMKGFSGRFFNFLGFNILFLIAATMIGFIIGIIFSFIAATAGALSLLFGFLAMVGMLVIVTVMFLGTPIIAFEKTNPIDAFGRIFTLSKGKWLSTFGLVVVVGIVGYIINFVFALPRGIVTGFEAFTMIQEDGDIGALNELMTNDPLSILFSVFESFGTIILYTLVYIALAFQYFNLVERRESRGLMTKIEQMDTEGEEESDEDY
ncbi:hypothetical protein [Roseivirga sp. E12]|uniref:hypothetical protein n=1 Tax=Roseivirga sp. E12 TaxID=2819237 RepID=UPI001ABCC692|nr:hypothetical protein [Roseivirga sp. E12]MBO3699484.1 hypothetical protein [Roseivirga sp. E12]